MQLQKFFVSQDTFTLPTHLIYQLFKIINSVLIFPCIRKCIKYLDAATDKLSQLNNVNY